MTHHEWEQVQEATRTVRSRWSGTPTVGLVLGTGLGALAREIDAAAAIPYPEIPYFPRSTVESHKGQLVCGTLAGHSRRSRWKGRFHLYEGYTPSQVTFPIRVMKELGCRLLIVSNAAGGLNPHFEKGDLIVIEDHINLMGVNPLIGPNDDRLGPRFPDMIEPYDRELQNLALQVALEQNIVAHRGVYVAVTGPNLETRAEYRFLRAIGADVVGCPRSRKCWWPSTRGSRCWASRSRPTCAFPMRWSRSGSRRSSPWPTRPRPSCGRS